MAAAWRGGAGEEAGDGRGWGAGAPGDGEVEREERVVQDRGGRGGGEFAGPLRAGAEQPHAGTTARQLAEDAHRLARVSHGILEARRGGIGADLDDRVEHQYRPGAVVADRGGELPASADAHAHRREPERLARDLGGIFAHDERALVEGALDPEQRTQQRGPAHGTGAPSTRVAMRS